MPNLVVEYQKRHKDTAIPVCHDGVCFFDKPAQASIVALTSLVCRPFSTCAECDNKQATVIVELFQGGGYAGQFMLTGHHHVNPCSNLLAVMKQMGLNGWMPYYANRVRDLEFWLWNFITKGKVRGFKPVETDKDLRLLEYMVYTAQKQPKVYNAYYIAYEAFLPQRRYLLFK